MKKNIILNLSPEIFSENGVIYSDRKNNVTISLPWSFAKGGNIKIKLIGGTTNVEVSEV